MSSFVRSPGLLSETGKVGYNYFHTKIAEVDQSRSLVMAQFSGRCITFY